MTLVSMKDVLNDAMNNQYAVPAFNVCNLEYCKAVIETAEEVKAPVIVAIHPVENKYAGIEVLTNIVKTLANKVSVPVVLHLDHGDGIGTTVQSMRYGFTSVMYDGSKYEFSENVYNTKEVVKIAHSVGIPVEGELGIVGGAEGDDYVHVDSLDLDQLTDPDTAVTFVKETGIDSLAVAIGSAHGLYKGEPRIDIERLKQIRSKVDIPLVLHGGSGTPDKVIVECIKNGISKINIASELKYAFHKGIVDLIEENPSVYEPLVVLEAAQKAAKELVRSKFELFQTEGKAKNFNKVLI
ncbi:class II fructose-bisphosphate aldolase [Neobacillus sp. Marseille-QA0830]